MLVSIFFFFAINLRDSLICSQKKVFFFFSHKALVFVVGHLKPAIENDFASCLSCNAVIYKTIHKASEAGLRCVGDGYWELGWRVSGVSAFSSSSSSARFAPQKNLWKRNIKQ